MSAKQPIHALGHAPDCDYPIKFCTCSRRPKPPPPKDTRDGRLPTRDFTTAYDRHLAARQKTEDRKEFHKTARVFFVCVAFAIAAAFVSNCAGPWWEGHPVNMARRSR